MYHTIYQILKCVDDTRLPLVASRNDFAKTIDKETVKLHNPFVFPNKNPNEKGRLNCEPPNSVLRDRILTQKKSVA